MKQTLFLSYSWSDTAIADKIDIIFQPTGVDVKRDIRNIGYKGNIKEYMAQIRDTDFVLLIISDSFIKSSNCMFEVLELIKDKDFKEKMLPVVMDGTKIFKADDKLEYIKYWTKQHADLKAKLEGVNTTDALELYKELKHIENIRTTIDEFLGHVSGISVPSFSTLSNQNFKLILDHIGVSDRVIINKILALAKLPTEDEKEIELDKLENEFPNNSKLYVAKAIHAYRQGKIANSSYFYRKSIQLDPTFSHAYYNLAFNVEVYDQDFDEAKKLYEKAIKLGPKDTRAMNNLAGLYSKELHNPKKARDLYEQALDINPYDAEAHYNLATLVNKYFTDDKEIAKQHYEIALDIMPDFADALHNYALLMSEVYGDVNTGITIALRAISVEPLKKTTLKLLGSLYENEKKDNDSAKVYYDRWIAIEPNTAADHHFYAMFLVLYFLPEFKTQARQHYEAACDLDSSCESDAADSMLD